MVTPWRTMLSALPSHDGVVGVVVDVDEPGRNGEARGVDGAGRGLARQTPHGGDPPAADSDIAREGGVPRAVHDAAAADQQIEILRARPRPPVPTAPVALSSIGG